MITTVGYKQVLENLVLSSPNSNPVITKIRVGDGLIDPEISDTDLSGLNKSDFTVVLTTSQPSVKGFMAVVPYDAMNGVTISEVGLITKDGALFSRQVLPTNQRVTKTSEMQIEIYWEVSV